VCGICGVIQLGGDAREVVEVAVLDRMTDAMLHRGPDDRGTHLAPGIALGVRRLSIIDVASGHQPFANESGDVWAVQNGELYNHDSIRAELASAGHGFRSRCDTEILPHLWERDGTGLSRRLHGKFALAVWDARTRRALLARDRLGVKPLYWARSDDLVVFASELKALLASDLVSATLDYEAIDAYLALGFVPAPSTPIAGVHKLMPGCQLVIDGESVREERYWSYPIPSPDEPPRPKAYYADELLALLRSAVRSRLMSDVPLGAMLSGGVDSSLVVALMSEALAAPVKTFSVGFREDAEFGELADAEHVASLFGTDHHAVELSFGDDTAQLADMVWHLDEPVADLSALGFLALSRLARKHVTVALSGQGADELLGGYERYRNVAIARVVQRIPRPLRSLSISALRLGPSRSRRMAEIAAAPGPVERTIALTGKIGQWRTPLRSGPLLDLPEAGDRRAISRVAARLPADADGLGAALFIDAQLSLPDDMLHYFDRASMAHSLEVRVPLLDHELVEFCARIPPSLKIHRFTTKYLLKEVARRFLPPRIVDKPKVGFFNRSVSLWIERQGARAIDEYLLDGIPRVADFIDMRALSRLATGSPDQRASAFRVLVLELWLERYAPWLSDGRRREPSGATHGR
jgi:asparagine synthase (glutamine-hydrolysing)